MTYEDNKTKRSTLRVMGCVRAFASYLCFLGDLQLRTLEFVDRKKVLWFFRKSNNSKKWKQRKMNKYCKRCRLRDGCLSKCKEAEVYEQGYNDAVEEFKTKSNGIQRKDP